MGLFAWWSRRIGGLSITGLVFVCSVVIFNKHQELKNGSPSTGRAGGNERFLAVLFAYYTLIIHIIVLVFPVRACWAIWDITRDLKKISAGRKLREFTSQRKLSTYLLSAETVTTSRASTISSDTENFDSGYLADIEPEIARNFHAVLIPNYKEDVDVLRETLDVLGSHPQARTQYDIFLAMEAREVNSDIKAMGLISEYLKKFHSISFTMHPADIPNDSPGKSSNISWAARKASERYISISRDDVIVTVVDADSHLSSNYFEEINLMHVKYPKTAPTTVYTPPIIFDRNAHTVPILVRVADIQWSAGGISGLYSGSWIGPPTSVYSLPLGLADKVGGWDSDCEAIGEDLHMYIKCFFALNGNLTRRTVLSPASQTNVSSDLKGTRGIVGGVNARYKQGLRHMWGSLDSGYALRQLITVWRDRKCWIRTFRPLHSTGSHKPEYIPDDGLENLLQTQIAGNGTFSDVCYHQVDPPNWSRITFLLHRMLEAHIIPTHIMVVIIASGIYTFIAKDQLDTFHIAWAFDVSGYIRTFGFGLFALYFALYEKFHEICVNTRKAEMKAAGLYENMAHSFSYRTFWGNILDYLIVPITAPLFGSMPAIQAQMSHFWTLDLVYKVSRKPSNKRGLQLECQV